MKSEAKKEKATALRLHNLRPRPGARHRVKRLGPRKNRESRWDDRSTGGEDDEWYNSK